MDIISRYDIKLKSTDPFDTFVSIDFFWSLGIGSEQVEFKLDCESENCSKKFSFVFFFPTFINQQYMFISYMIIHTSHYKHKCLDFLF